ncbi:GNAT family N-acetyltransferase [Frigoriglobus tundricola]|uniref:Ribosomal-protein-S5p-alanine acetyltransferase n=1 Tax=Frigoriglobus tundricola TaxID=2774151 RepID=A0A6M5YQL7_9BACT|nr:GNAT family protein [Frigoriglobus tundricola]QJW95710.1 Ribosomal-protein-S5p-alanine acetyltransferase [Frigoriglobus tundricola]
MMPHDWRPPTLTTPRLTLRPFTTADAAPLFEHARNPNVTRFTLWDAHQCIEETLAFVHDYALLRYREGTAEPYAITVTPDPRPIGACGCFWAAQPHQTMELGYWLAEPFWGQGLITEACHAVLAFSFAEYGPERMQARVIEGNHASARVLAKLGFRDEGTLRRSLFRRGKFDNVRMFSLLRDEWAAATAPAGKEARPEKRGR